MMKRFPISLYISRSDLVGLGYEEATQFSDQKMKSFASDLQERLDLDIAEEVRALFE
jgi:hypothetical protein